jgi:hypothetical protein
MQQPCRSGRQCHDTQPKACATSGTTALSGRTGHIPVASHKISLHGLQKWRPFLICGFYQRQPAITGMIIAALVCDIENGLKLTKSGYTEMLDR